MGTNPTGSASSQSTAQPPSDLAAVVAARAGHVPLVGRAGELARLRDALDAARDGTVRVVALAGEAGIGKSRLLNEATRQMTERGGLVAFGRCVDERGMPPYVPWLAALADLGDQTGTAETDPAPRGSDSSSLAPVGRRLQDLLLASKSRAAPRGPSPEERKLRAFDAVARSLAGIARQQPALLAFDDLQWSDEASNELLRYVAIHLPPVPLVIVTTYRSDESAGNAALTRTLQELDRRRLLTTIRVGPLAPDETARLLAGLLARPDPPRELAAAIHRHSEGNPFFAEEVVRALAEEGRLPTAPGTVAAPDVLPALPLPRAVAAVIERRLARLSAPCRESLDLAALCGREISIDLIAAASGLAEEIVAGHLEEAERVALVGRLSSDAAVAGMDQAEFAFLHDRIRETVAAGINPVRHRALHARLAAALETAPGGDDLARLATLAHHFQQARQTKRAAFYAERLGDEAMRAHAHAPAARAYQTALEHTPGSGNGADDRTQCALLLKLGDALLAASEPGAIAAYTAAERAYAEARDQRGAARALHRLGAAHARSEEHDAAIAALEAAVRTLDALSDDDDTRREISGVLVELATILGTSLARYDAAIRHGRRALDLASALGHPPDLEAAARLALGKALARSGQLPTGRALLEDAPALALSAGDPDLAAEVAGAVANQTYWLGDLDASERFAKRRRELAREAGDPYALRHALPWLALIAISRGEWTEATRLLAEAEADVSRVDSPEPRAFLHHIGGMMALRRGRHADAVARLEAGIAAFRQSGPSTLPWYLGCLAHAYQAAGDADAAAQTAAETADLIRALPPGCLPRAPSLAQLGIVAVRTGDVTPMRRWYGELRPYAGQHHWVLIDRVLGMLAAALGDAPAAERHLHAARMHAIRGGIRPELALAAAELAALHRRAAAPRELPAADQALARAVERLRALDMPGEADRFAALAQPETVAVASVYPAGLTEREVAVLALVAQGLTNREIGARLGIAEKTVTNHLTHVFTKANLDNRAAAVAFALRHGLDR